MAENESLIAKDLKHLWHPFTRINELEASPFPVMERGEGVFLFDTAGNRYLDGISSWWCVNLGHRHPALMEAVRSQLEVLDQSILGGLSHPNAIELAGTLARLLPEGLNRVLFASDGACAAEAALKISLQYWANLGRPDRNRFVSLVDAYHGDTLGAVGVGYVEAFHKSFYHALRLSHRAQAPHCFHCPFGKRPSSCGIECFSSMESIVREYEENVAAVIVEPLCQGAAGMRIYPPAYLEKLRKLCDKYSILLIADEIAVGFGRTGRLFACEHAGISPDIMCLGKALTGGVLPLSATVVTERIYDAFRSTPEADRTFYHGHTTCGSPITANVALSACKIYAGEGFLQRAEPAMKVLREGFEELSRFSCVHRTSSLGMASSMEIAPGAGGAAFARETARRALKLGLLVRPLGPVLYLWPPLVTSESEMAEMVGILKKALGEVDRRQSRA